MQSYTPGLAVPSVQGVPSFLGASVILLTPAPQASVTSSVHAPSCLSHSRPAVLRAHACPSPVLHYTLDAQVDLGEPHQLVLNYYTLRHDGSDAYARSWVVQVHVRVCALCVCVGGGGAAEGFAPRPHCKRQCASDNLSPS
jgi:hypothetical protein